MYGFYQPYGGNEQLVRVTGLDGAKAYQMRPNSAVALFDGAEDIFISRQPTVRVSQRFEFSDSRKSQLHQMFHRNTSPRQSSNNSRRKS